VLEEGGVVSLYSDIPRYTVAWQLNVQVSNLMQPTIVPGTEGYSEDAEWLIPRYESISFVDKYRAVFEFLPTKTSTILDIGAGTGIDSAWFATNGHDVIAVEPTAAFREAGIRLHASHRIEWLDDCLPALSKITSRKVTFDVVLITAVWSHLAPLERVQAMSTITGLLKSGGVLVMSIRHGTAPPNRRVFEVSAEETVELAMLNGVRLILKRETPSVQFINRQAEVTWSWLVFKR
jgi:2-polyprenyl-3-methyl-5-hydroxy-6-metoxy-1,4-benzoquinol methylase